MTNTTCLELSNKFYHHFLSSQLHQSTYIPYHQHLFPQHIRDLNRH
jgi:hypothetical protein